MMGESNAASRRPSLDGADLGPPPARARVLVAVSGGIDSSALAVLLQREQRCRRLELGWVIHGFRPRDEAREHEVLQALARRLSLPLHVRRLEPPPPRERSTPGIPEAWARRMRYAALTELARSRDLDVLATGHHAGDQLETQLLHLHRGSGLRGLLGIPRERAGEDGLRIWRPLLGWSKAALREELRRVDLRWAEDPSNQDRSNRRNRARHLWLPALRREQDPLLARLPDWAALAERALERIEARSYGWLRDRAAPSILRELRLLPASPLRRLSAAFLHHLLESWSGRRLRGAESRELSRWIRADGRGRRATADHDVLRSGPWIGLQPLHLASELRAASRAWEVPLDGAPIVAPPHPSISWSIELGPQPASSPWQARLPSGTILRHRRPGDALQSCRQGRRRLKALFIDHAVPGPERLVWPVFEHRGRVIWVPGLARSPEAPAEHANARVRGIPDPRARRLQALSEPRR